MKKEYIKSVLDGIIQGILLCLFPEYILSTFFVDEPIELNIVFIIILCVLSLISFYFLILRKTQKIWVKSFISFISFFAILLLNFINLMTLHIMIIPLREVSNADGLFVLFFVGPYLAVVIISRIIALIITLIINKTKK